jgi:ABC-type transport system involved in multi-copper enzyme maturation permease subunit
MKGLLLKELLMFKQRLFVFVILIIMFCGFGIFGNCGVLSMMSAFLGMFLFGHLNYDEQSKWNIYSIAMPYGRKTIVSSKYIAMIISTVFSTVLVVITLAAAAALGKIDFSAELFITYVTTSLFIGMLYPSLILPFAYKFNSEKSRMVMIVASGFMGGLLGTCASVDFVTKILVRISRYSDIIPYISLTVTIVLFVLSWGLSVKIYEKRDL